MCLYGLRGRHFFVIWICLIPKDFVRSRAGLFMKLNWRKQKKSLKSLNTLNRYTNTFGGIRIKCKTKFEGGKREILFILVCRISQKYEVRTILLHYYWQGHFLIILHSYRKKPQWWTWRLSFFLFPCRIVVKKLLFISLSHHVSSHQVWSITMENMERVERYCSLT